MRTTSNPYKRKVGLNVFTSFVKFIKKGNEDYLDILFMQNEREALGRRLLVMIFLLQGYDYRKISSVLGCGKNTIADVNSKLANSDINEKKLLKDLVRVFYDQSPEYHQKERVGGSKTVSGTLRILGLSGTEPVDTSRVDIDIFR